MTKFPCGGLLGADESPQDDGGYPFAGTGDQVHCQEPGPQGKFSRVHRGLGGNCELMPASSALVEACTGRLTLDVPGFYTSTMGADTAIGPNYGFKEQTAGCLIRILLAQLVDSHGYPSSTRKITQPCDRICHTFFSGIIPYRNSITPYDVYPEYREEKTLRDVIYDFPRLEWGEVSSNDFYHAFRTYDPKMQSWIHGLKEGESAFDNPDPSKRPHRVKDGKIVENIRKNRDKYTRQPWDRFIQCIHTRNDQLAAQNTIHPEQDRVYSVRELMEMMSIPVSFRWIDMDLDGLNSLTVKEKLSLYKTHEMNIRQCIGEAVPTEVMRLIACNIKKCLLSKRYESVEINKLISELNLEDRTNLKLLLKTNPRSLDISSLIRVAELCNAKRESNAAFYTNKFIVNEIVSKLPNFGKDEVRILEPSIGAGSFLPFLFKRYEDVGRVILDCKSACNNDPLWGVIGVQN